MIPIDSFFGALFVIAFLALFTAGDPDLYDALMFHLSGQDLEQLKAWVEANAD